MKYLFEDNKVDTLSQLFQVSYDAEEREHFIYAEGNGNLIDIAYSLLNLGETVIVFIDMVPDNENANSIYRSLCELYDETKRIVVIPILCAEYYMIKFLYNVYPQYCIDSIEVQRCLCCTPWFDSPMLKTREDIAFVRSFETYCKLVLRKCFISCIAQKGTFYLESCKCMDAIDVCVDAPLQWKSANLLRHYPCFPYVGLTSRLPGCTGTGTLSLQRILDICNTLCFQYNELVEKFAVADPDAKKKYRKIRLFTEYRSTESSRRKRLRRMKNKAMFDRG